MESTPSKLGGEKGISHLDSLSFPKLSSQMRSGVTFHARHDDLRGTGSQHGDRGPSRVLGGVPAGLQSKDLFIIVHSSICTLLELN